MGGEMLATLEAGKEGAGAGVARAALTSAPWLAGGTGDRGPPSTPPVKKTSGS